jgi:methylthioribose-1-phosphate isomerase
MIRPVEWRSGAVVLLDQRLLPMQEVYRVYRDHRDVARAIKDMVVRGAPAIGVAAGMGIALGMVQASDGDLSRSFDRICRRFAATRPTAVNLFWAIDRMRRAFGRVRGRSPEVVREILRQEAVAIYHEDIANNRALGKYCAALLRPRTTVLTHCNAGALATA